MLRILVVVICILLKHMDTKWMSMKDMLEEIGFTEVNDYEKADLVFLDTCSIRKN